MVIGNNGSGKSYFSEKLSGNTSLPLIHLDLIFWQKNWQMPSKDEWRSKISSLVSEDEWILDGNVNHGGTLDIRFASADLVIFLDISRITCLFGLIKRYGRKRADMPHYLDEKLSRGFFKLCRGIWTFPNDRKKNIMHLKELHPETKFVSLKNRREMREFLNN